MYESPYLTASSPEINVWVSAAAGSGKTKILVDRFLRLLLKGVDPRKILCITFTNSAAAEMVQRITTELSVWAVCDENELRSKISALTGVNCNQQEIERGRKLFLECLDKRDSLQIQTIHSFCQSIVSQFPLETGITQHSTIIDDYQKSSLIEQTKYDFLTNYEKICGDQGDVKFLLENINEISLNKLIDNALFLSNFSSGIITSEVEKKEYLEKLYKILKYDQNYLDKLDHIKIEFIKVLRNNSAIISKVGILRGFYHLNEAQQMEEFHELKNFFLTKDGSKKLKLIPKSTIDKSPELIEILELLQHKIFEYSEFEKSINIAKFTTGFINLGYAINNIFLHNKELRNQIDFNDLIRLSLKLMTNPDIAMWVKYRLSSQISYIMIDESQDTNLNQWSLIYSIIEDFFDTSSFEKKTLFVVGDPKQSIYSFQGSSPEIFLSMHQIIKNFAKNYGIKINDVKLSRSFRSDQLILKFVDAVFEKINAQNPAYFIESSVNHFSEIKSTDASVDVWPLVIEEEKQLANNIADYIKGLLSTGAYKASDIMILVRKRDVLVNDIIASLKDAGVPVNGADRVTLNKELAVQDLVAVAKFILLPEDDYNLACILKSPILGMSEDDLFTLSQRDNGVSLWDTLKNLQDKNESFKAAHQFLCMIADNYDLHSPYNLFSYLLDVLRIRTKILSRFGIQVDEILNQFLSATLEFEKSSMSLIEFISFFENSNESIKVNLNFQKDEVKIMTVHTAKGLEAKVVILPDTTSVPQNKNNIIFDVDDNLILYNGGAENNNELYRKSAGNVKLKIIQEYYRLLYVALTRASKKLVICGVTNSKNISEESWYCVLKSVAENFQPALTTLKR